MFTMTFTQNSNSTVTKVTHETKAKASKSARDWAKMYTGFAVVTTDGGEVVYTTDGSKPNKNTEEYYTRQGSTQYIDQ